jgi:hypothetical protein
MTLLLLIGACAPPSLEACDDAACLEEAVLRAWAEDPAATARRGAALEDPVVRFAAASVVIEAWPGHAGTMCAALPEGDARTRCVTIDGRPHLQGPALETRAPPPPREASPAVDCPHPLLVNTCHAKAAVKAAIAGDWTKADAICRVLEAGRWRDECRFEAAEAALVEGGAQVAGEVAVLCLGTGAFVEQCLAHEAVILGRQAPAADDGTPGVWDVVLQGERNLWAGLGGLNRALAEGVSERLWSEATQASYLRARRPVGNPLDALPPGAAPQVRAALAWRLWDLESGQHRTLAQWQARLVEAMAERSETAPGPVPDLPPVTAPMLREAGPPGEDVLPRVLYLGKAWRAFAEDPGTDALVCLLEAAARNTAEVPSSGPPGGQDTRGPSDAGRALLQEALGHADPTVRWTATRLLSASSRP